MARKAKLVDQIEAPKPPTFSNALKKVPIGDLKPAAHNPKSRTDTRLKRMDHLIKSIEEVGLVQPITVDKDMNIIDGHRRWKACQVMGWEHVPVIIFTTDNPNAVYAGVNAAAEMMSGLQVLEVYLKEPTAVTARTRSTLEKFEEQFGRVMLKRLVKAKLSYRLFATANQIARYCEDDSSAFLDSAAEWLINHRNQRHVRHYMALKQSPSKLWEIVNKAKELEVTFA